MASLEAGSCQIEACDIADELDDVGVEGDGDRGGDEDRDAAYKLEELLQSSTFPAMPTLDLVLEEEAARRRAAEVEANAAENEAPL